MTFPYDPLAFIMISALLLMAPFALAGRGRGSVRPRVPPPPPPGSPKPPRPSR